MPVKINATVPVSVTIDITGTNLPVLAAYRFWFKNPDDVISAQLGTGTDEGPDDPTAYPFQLRGLEDGSQVSYFVKLFSNGSQPYQVVLTLAQQGQPLAGGITKLAGNLGDDGTTVLQGKILFAV